MLSLPSEFPDRDLLRVMAFGVVLFTLLVQGTTMHLFLRRLGLTRRSQVALEFERRRGRLLASRAARDRLHALYVDEAISASTRERLSDTLDEEVRKHLSAQRDLVTSSPELLHEELANAHQEGLRAQRATLATLLADGMISEDAYDELLSELEVNADRPGEAEKEKSGPADEGQGT